MFLIPDMSQRVFLPEIMDDPLGADGILFKTLREFRTINHLFSRTRTLVKRYLIPSMLRQGKREIVIADIGAGGGDFALWITGYCRSKGIRLKALCVDNDPRVVRFARDACKGRDDIAVIEASAFSLDTIEGPIDYFFTNHFLHHIPTVEIPGLLKMFYDRARVGVLINDLARSTLAYVGFTLFCFAFFRSYMSRVDGLLSIRKGFLKKDLTDLVSRASLASPVTVGMLHPGRVFLYCQKQDAPPSFAGPVTRRRTAVVAGLLFAGALQLPLLAAPSPCKTLCDDGNIAYDRFDNQKALALFQEAYKRCPPGYEPLMKFTRAIVDEGMDIDSRLSNDFYEKGIRYADTLQQRFPDSAQSFFLKAVAAGNLARREIGTNRLKLAREIGTNAERAIALDPSFAPAYIVQGVYYREVATAGKLQTLAADLFLGGMPKGTLEDSRRSLQKALGLAPENIYALLELARTMMAMNDSAEAVRLLKKQQGCPVRWYMDGRLKKEGAVLLGVATENGF